MPKHDGTKLHSDYLESKSSKDTLVKTWDVARHYLNNSALSSEEISFLLGFQDPSSFSRVYTAAQNCTTWRRWSEESSHPGFPAVVGWGSLCGSAPFCLSGRKWSEDDGGLRSRSRAVFHEEPVFA